jgi:hypothetical protein
MDPYGMTYSDFLQMNPASALEVFFFVSTAVLSLITFSVCFWGFGRIRLSKKEGLFSAIHKSLVTVFILLNIRLHLMHLASASHGDTFQTKEAVWSFYNLLTALGSMTYELTWLISFFILAKVAFFWKVRNEIGES